MSEGITKLVGAAVGAAVSWPCVTVLLDAPPHFDGAENWGSVIGAILGVSIHSFRGLFRKIGEWSLAGKAASLTALAATWLFLLTYFKQVFDSNFGSGTLGPKGLEQVEIAEHAVTVIAFLFAVPLAIAFAAGAEEIELRLSTWQTRRREKRKEKRRRAVDPSTKPSGPSTSLAADAAANVPPKTEGVAPTDDDPKDAGHP